MGKCRFGAGLLGLPLAIFADGHASVNIGSGKHACAVFHTPQCWHETTQYRACRVPELPDIKLSLEHGRYVFRQNADHVSIGYEYPRGASPQDSGHLERFVVPGEEHYEIDMGPPPRLRPITQDEWSRQTPLSITARTAKTTRAFYPESDTAVRAVEFAGRSFPKTGPRFPFADRDATSVSATEKFLTVHSWAGTENTCDAFLCFGLPPHGRYWIDLYDVSSGKRVVALSGRYWNLEAVGLFGATIWLGDRYFVLPLTGDLRTFLFCDMTRLPVSKTK
jgi:hypothetical protein